MTNNNIQKELLNFLKTKGVKQRFIAQKTNLSDCTISLFLKNKRALSQDKLEIIYYVIRNYL